MPKFNVFPDDAKIVEDPQGDTFQLYENDRLDLDQVGHLGDWKTRQDHGSTIGHAQLTMPIIFIDDSHKKVLVPRGAYLHYSHEGFFIWKESFHKKVEREMEE